MIRLRTFLFLGTVFFLSCDQVLEDTFNSLLEGSPFIEGKTNYLNSPYVTAGDRVYMVGHQNGTFPELGWHIKGEMGGIWNHPIKLMDGFEVDLIWGEEVEKLDNAHLFVNYPFANKHIYRLKDRQLSVERWQFVPTHKEGIAIQFSLTNTGETPTDFSFRFKGQADLRPTWLGARTQMIDHQDKATYHSDLGTWMVKDSLNPWFVTFGADEQPIEYQAEAHTSLGKGASGSLTYPISLPPQGRKIINFTIAGSYHTEEAALATYQDIQANLRADIQQKRLYYEKLADKSKLSIPDKHLQQSFEWLKYNCDWLVRSVPEIGTGIAAGIPDYPWWFGVDSEYALKGYMAIGQREVVYQTIELLDSISRAVNGNGRIVHEVSTNGAVFNQGNINETPQFASLIWEVYRWNGDMEFLRKYFPTIKKGLAWLLRENDANQNLFPDGFGMMEIHGLDSEMIDVAAYTQRAFEDASKMALELGDENLASHYQKTAYRLREKINQEFWSEAFSAYADFIGTDQQALKLIDEAMVRADTLQKPWAMAELKETKAFILAHPSTTPRPFVLHHNWVVNTPMEMKIADEQKALLALQTAEKFTNPFGVFVTGIDRDASAASEEGSFKGSKVFSYTGAVMTLPTGVLVVAENNYGRTDKALNYLKRMSKTFSYAFPGSMYEVSPDYGMITQAWNIYGFAVPIVQQFFGIHPQASQKKVLIKPQMPDEWDEASLEQVLVGDNEVSIYYEKSAGYIKWKIEQTKAGWIVDLVLPKVAGKTYEPHTASVETTDLNDQLMFRSEEMSFEVRVRE